MNAFTAFEIGKGIHASMIIIPEMFNKTQITIDKIVRLIISSMIKRRIVGQKFGVVVVGEGIFHFLQDEDIASSGITFDYDAHGHPELSEVSKAHVISKILKNRLKELNLDIICLNGLFARILRCFPLQSVRIAAENRLVCGQKSSPFGAPCLRKQLLNKKGDAF